MDEIRQLFSYVRQVNPRAEVLFEPSLARGLNYYTSTIIEVKAIDMEMGSICGGGRYDDLTGIFGLQGMSGVGISFGADRIYDVMNQLELFPRDIIHTTGILFVNFGPRENEYSLRLIGRLHEAGIAAELYPDTVKLKKQLSYADARKINFVVLAGEEEMTLQQITLKDMATGRQQKLSLDELIQLMGDKQAGFPGRQ